MRILEFTIMVAMALGGAHYLPIDNSEPCTPDDVCYPIDPNPPKPVPLPPNCWIDSDGGVTCNPIDESGK